MFYLITLRVHNTFIYHYANTFCEYICPEISERGRRYHRYQVGRFQHSFDWLLEPTSPKFGVISQDSF